MDASLEQGQRWVFPFYNVMGMRILPVPEHVAYFSDHGMPVSPALYERTGKWVDDVKQFEKMRIETSENACICKAFTIIHKFFSKSQLTNCLTSYNGPAVMTVRSITILAWKNSVLGHIVLEKRPISGSCSLTLSTQSLRRLSNFLIFFSNIWGGLSLVIGFRGLCFPVSPSTSTTHSRS